jgi:hypothetical protein
MARAAVLSAFFGLGCQPGGSPVASVSPEAPSALVPAAAPVPADAPVAGLPPTPVPTAPGTLPLAEGHRWTFVEEVRRGAGLRVLGFPTQRATTERLGTRTLEIGSQDPHTGRFVATVTQQPAAGPAQSVTTEVWTDAEGTWMVDEAGRTLPALVVAPLPDPLSIETVSCDMALLGVKGGRCAALPGGPRNTAPGLLGVVLADDSGLKPLGQVLVGVMTAGIFIPGNRSPVQVLELEAFSPAPASDDPFMAAVDAAGPFAEAGQIRVLLATHRPGVEALAAALLPLRDPGTLAAVVPDALQAVPAADRHRLLRAVLRHRLDNDSVAVFLAGLPHLPRSLSASQRAALANAVPTRAALLWLLLDAEQPFLAAWLGAGEGRPDADLLSTLPAELQPSAAERRAVLSLLKFDNARRETLAAFVARLPPSEHPAVFLEVFGTLGFDAARVASLADHGPLVASLSLEDRSSLLAQLGFDAGRAEALVTLLAHAPVSEHPALFVAAYETLGFDDKRLALVAAHPELVAGLSAVQREAMLARMRFSRDALEALLGDAR